VITRPQLRNNCGVLLLLLTLKKHATCKSYGVSLVRNRKCIPSDTDCASEGVEVAWAQRRKLRQGDTTSAHSASLSLPHQQPRVGAKTLAVGCAALSARRRAVPRAHAPVLLEPRVRALLAAVARARLSSAAHPGL